jgi:DNA-binding cell septation regulator SpoVG
MQIENFREQNPSDKCAAIFDITLESGLVFRNWKLLKSAKGNKFLAGPSFSTEDEFGKKTWHAYIDFSSSEKKKDFERKVMKELEAFL